MTVIMFPIVIEGLTREEAEDVAAEIVAQIRESAALESQFQEIDPDLVKFPDPVVIAT